MQVMDAQRWILKSIAECLGCAQEQIPLNSRLSDDARRQLALDVAAQFNRSITTQDETIGELISTITRQVAKTW